MGPFSQGAVYIGGWTGRVKSRNSGMMPSKGENCAVAPLNLATRAKFCATLSTPDLRRSISRDWNPQLSTSYWRTSERCASSLIRQAINPFRIAAMV